MSNSRRKVGVVSRCSPAGLMLALVTVTSLGLIGAGCSGPGKDDPAGVPQAPMKSTSKATPDDLSRATAVRHMTQHAAAHLLPANPSLKVMSLRRDQLRQSHVRLQQLVGDVPVLGGEMIVHLDENQQVLSVTDAVVPGMMAAPPVAAISEQDAVDAALAALGCSDCLTSPPEVSRWILRRNGHDSLTFRVQLRIIDGTKKTSMPLYFVDASNGQIVWNYENLQTATAVSLYSGTVDLDTFLKAANNTHYLEDVARKLGTFDMRNGTSTVFPFDDADDVWDSNVQKAGVDAQFGLLKTFQYYKDMHERTGINGLGGPGVMLSQDGVTMLITSRVHYSSGYSNAFWDGSQMTYGDGDGTTFTPLVTLDIAGHELTHGVTQFTAGLIYQGESGALNEATSDIFGAMVERSVRGETDGLWKVGEQAYTPTVPGDALRFMDNPHAASDSGFTADDDPDHYTERYLGGADSGGVHINSGIANKAFYLIAHGGTHHKGGTIDTVDDPASSNERAVGAEKAANIWYRALTVYMTSSTNFAAAAAALVHAADDLYGVDGPESKTVFRAWAMCGVTVDRAAPTASITAPAAGATVSATTSVVVSATDDVAVKSVEFYVDGTLKATVTTAPYQWAWQTWLSGNGMHTLTAKVFDTSTNATTSAPVAVTVSNEDTPPTVAITAPADGASVALTVPVVATAADASGIARVEFYLDTTLIGQGLFAPYQVSWNTALTTNGAHALTAKAFDTLNNSATSAPVNVIVDNDRIIPTVSITAPVDGSTVADNVIISASASDNSGVVSRVEFYADGVLLGSDTTSPFAFAWNTGLLDDGARVLTAKAFDALNNVGVSPPVTVNVVNPGRAVFDATLKAPRCTEIQSACDTGGLVVGRGTIGPESHAPNTLASACADGLSGSFHVDESLDRLRIFTDDGTPFAVGKSVTVQVTAFVWGTADKLDLYIAPNAASPAWQFLATIQPPATGLQVMSKTFNLPAGNNQAIRGNFRFSGGVGFCTAGSFDDRDDLVFAVGGSDDTTPPTVAVTGPAEGSTLAGTVLVSASASDQSGIASVEFLVDGVVKGSTNLGPYTFSLNTVPLENGPHLLTARAMDSIGNVATSAPVMVTVTNDKTAPTVALTAPAADATVAGTVSVSADASDDSGTVSRVDFVLDSATGVPFASDSAPPFSVQWDTLLAGEGAHTLFARAVDAAGNATTSAGVAVTVVNPGQAAYDTTLKAPRCTTTGSSCDTGTLVRGRAGVGPEPHAPNTINSSCADGTAGVFHADESLDRLRVSTQDGSPLAAGKTVKIDATVWVWSATANFLDLYSAPSAQAPVWTLIGTLQAPVTGQQTLSKTFVLPSGPLQAIRGSFREQGSAAPCTFGSFDDHDDLIFAVDSVDSTAPTATVTAPAANAVVGGTVMVTASASDDVGVTSVQFLVDGIVAATVSSAPYAFAWNAGAAGEGPHQLAARATDAAGNVGNSAPVAVLVDTTAPVVTIVAPAPNAFVRGLVHVTATAGDASGVTSVQLLVDNVAVTNPGTPSLDLIWNSALSGDGLHQLQVVALDGAGNAGASDALVVSVDNTPPITSIATPTAGALVSGVVPVTVQATDNLGVAHVDLVIDEAASGSVSTEPYTFSWDSRAVMDGPHQLQATATDGLGNSAAGPQVTVVVDNTPPTVAVTAPASGATVSGVVNVQAAASDATTAVAAVEFFLDGALQSTDSAAPYAWSWNSVTASTGSHTLTARATDQLGNQATSAAVIVNVPAACTPSNGSGNGLRGDYFDNRDLTAWRLTRTDPTVNFSWGTAAPAPGIGADTFSVRWTGEVQPRFSGTYTFTTTSDDGVRLWVNEQAIVNNWTNHGVTDNSGTITLVGGQRYTIRMESYDDTGSAVARLAWASACQVKEFVPTSQLYAAATGSGLRGEYFDNVDFTGTKVIRNDATVNFDWGQGAPVAGIGVDTFSVRWTGEIDLPSSETYTFYTTSDDGIRLWVNGQAIVNNWTSHAAVENSGTITLAGGKRYSIRLEYFDNAKSAVARLSWSTPSIPKAIIPAGRLFPAP